jgi:hypothetical protein
MLNVVLYSTKDLSIDWDFRVQYLRTVANLFSALIFHRRSFDCCEEDVNTRAIDMNWISRE